MLLYISLTCSAGFINCQQFHNLVSVAAEVKLSGRHIHIHPYIYMDSRVVANKQIHRSAWKLIFERNFFGQRIRPIRFIGWNATRFWRHRRALIRFFWIPFSPHILLLNENIIFILVEKSESTKLTCFMDFNRKSLFLMWNQMCMLISRETESKRFSIVSRAYN